VKETHKVLVTPHPIGLPLPSHYLPELDMVSRVTSRFSSLGITMGYAAGIFLFMYQWRLHRSTFSLRLAIGRISRGMDPLRGYVEVERGFEAEEYVQVLGCTVLVVQWQALSNSSLIWP